MQKVLLFDDIFSFEILEAKTFAFFIRAIKYHLNEYFILWFVLYILLKTSLPYGVGLVLLLLLLLF